MKAPELTTSRPLIQLVEPVVGRDAALGVEWLNSNSGFDTLQAMGVPPKYIEKTTLENERIRIKDFIEKADQLNWMINFEGRIVGSVWVDLHEVGSVGAPAIHIMIGDPSARGKGVGSVCIEAALSHLRSDDVKKVHSRYLVKNKAAKKMLEKFAFKNDGDSYKDDDGLVWQNVASKLYWNKENRSYNENN